MNRGFIIIFIVLLFSHGRICANELLESMCQPTEEQKELEENGVYYCLNHIKNVCNENYRTDKDIQYLMNIFNVSRAAARHRMRITKSMYATPKLFINIESVYSSKRTYICKRVARHFYAKYFLSPPKFMLEERKRYTDRIPKRLYYSLSKYSSSFHVKGLLCTRPVVLERYWLDHATFLIAKKYENSSSLPSADSTIYNWPIDLLKPNVIFFINASRSMQDVGYEYNNFTDRFTTVLRRMKNVNIVEINPNRNSNVIIQEIIKYIEDRSDTEFKNMIIVNRTKTNLHPTFSSIRL